MGVCLCGAVFEFWPVSLVGFRARMAGPGCREAPPVRRTRWVFCWGFSRPSGSSETQFTYGFLLAARQNVRARFALAGSVDLPAHREAPLGLLSGFSRP
jgi:hypothetical protein